MPDAATCPSHGLLPPSAPAAISSETALAPQAALAEHGYRVLGLLGRGGFGAVYAAERVSDRASVAIKLVLRDQPGAAERLECEQAALRAIGAPYVPSLIDSGEIHEGFYLVMERIEAPTLAERMLELAGPRPLAVFSTLARALLTPVEAVHARGLLHCDLKPENIFILPTGGARLIDFGLARQLEASSQLVPADDEGTAEYMSPEQCQHLLCDRSSDVYSLGILFYELLSGAPPFWGPAADVREAQLSQRPQPLSRKLGCPIELDQLLRRCLAKDPERRFENVAALRSALDSVLRSGASSLFPGSLRPRTSQAPVTLKLSAARREQRAMGLVFFDCTRGVGAVQAAVLSARGQIVHVHGSQYAAAFGHEAGANPARVALHAAQHLLAAQLTLRVLVDVASVAVHIRPDGSCRVASRLLTKADRYPRAHDPLGVTITRAAAEVLPDLELRPALTDQGDHDRFLLTAAQSGGEELQPLVGREDILEQLLSSAARVAQQAQPALLTVLGPPGHGRTHLAAIVARELRHSAYGFEVIELSAQEGAASEVLPKLLRRALWLPKVPPADLKALFRSRLGDAGEATWAGVAHALGWLAAEHPEVQRLAAAPGTLRLIAARAVSGALQRMAANKPLAVLLDDAHLADEATLDALQYATRSDVASPIWVCVLAPPSFATIRATWYARAGAVHYIPLPELAPKHAIELARRLLLPAEFIPEAELAKLAERTQGVPRLLVELTRGLKRDGFVRKSERGTGYYLATDELDKLSDLPIAQWNAIREIEALPPQLGGLARLAAVLGSSFSLAEVDALFTQLEQEDMPEDALLDPSAGIIRLVSSGILVRHAGELIDFRHAVLRDMIYRLVPEAQRAQLHRAAFEVYRTLELPEHVRLPRLAKHAARCGERELAASAYLELAQRALRAQAYLEAEAAYSGALENLDTGDARVVAATRGRGLMRARSGRQEAALADLRSARELAHARAALHDELEIMLDEANVLDWLRETNGAIALVREVEAASTAKSPLLRARLAMCLARTCYRLGEIDAAIRVGQEAVALTAALGDAGYETRMLAQLLLGTCYPIVGKLAQAEHTLEQVIAEAEARGDLRHVSLGLGNRAFLWHRQRNDERLFADLTRAAQLARELGDASLEFVSVYNLAESEYLLQLLEPAREHAQRTLELAKQHFGEINSEVSSSELLVARIALYRGDLLEAQRLTTNIRERIERGRALNDVDVELEPSAQLLLEMVELSVAVAALPDWQSLLERARSLELQPSDNVELLERAALCVAQLGEWSFGRELYQQALALCRDKPSLIVERLLRKLEPIFGDSA